MTSVESGSETRLSDIFFASLLSTLFFFLSSSSLSLHPPPFLPSLLSSLRRLSFSLFPIVVSAHRRQHSFIPLLLHSSLLHSLPALFLPSFPPTHNCYHNSEEIHRHNNVHRPKDKEARQYVLSPIHAIPSTLYFFSFSLLPPHHCQPVFPQSTYLGSSLSLQAFSFINTHFTQHTPAHKRTQRCYKYQTTFSS